MTWLRKQMHKEPRQDGCTSEQSAPQSWCGGNTEYLTQNIYLFIYCISQHPWSALQAQTCDHNLPHNPTSPPPLLAILSICNTYNVENVCVLHFCKQARHCILSCLFCILLRSRTNIACWESVFMFINATPFRVHL